MRARGNGCGLCSIGRAANRAFRAGAHRGVLSRVGSRPATCDNPEKRSRVAVSAESI